MRVNWKRAWCYHGNSKCGCICNWGDTQTYTCAAVLTSATLLSWYGKPGGCTSRNQTLLTDHTHKTTHIVPGGNNSSIWSLAASGLAFIYLFIFFKPKQWGCLSVAIKRWSSRARCRQSKTKAKLGNKQAIKADQLQVRGHMIQTLNLL